MSYSGQNYYYDGYGYGYPTYPQYGYQQPTVPTHGPSYDQNYYTEGSYYVQQYVPEYQYVPESAQIASNVMTYPPVNPDVTNQVRAVCEQCFSNTGLAKVTFESQVLRNLENLANLQKF